MISITKEAVSTERRLACSAQSSTPALRLVPPRPRVGGKFFVVGDQKLYIRGVTYGPFRPGPCGCEYHDPEIVERDLSQIAASGINAIRTYTAPPRWLLDCAQQHGLWVLVGLPWEQPVAFLGARGLARRIERRVRDALRSCAAHPAVLAYAIGNEIPSGIVRWHGRRRVERHIERLYQAAKAEDPGGLVTYINYPSTEYLDLPFLDFLGFNVYLESPRSLAGYLARLQNRAGDKPMVLAETGLDSSRNGEELQAQALGWQLRVSFDAGCAGVFVFAWTDEWHRGGEDIEDWDFGLTRRDRREKPSLRVVRDAFAKVPFPAALAWPRISVVVCTYNGTATLADCLAGLQAIQYPSYEVIVVNDGSNPRITALAQQYGAQLRNISHSGLSVARNVGSEAASGEIVAYLDDDARPDPHWLQYLAQTFMTTDYAAVGGPNIPPPNESRIAQCVAHAPGGPVPVLLSDHEAEHIPGCNMAFRKAALRSIGGFDPQFWVAGDDVDLCWRLRDAGFKIGFNPGAMVWHHRRRRVQTYWKQQLGYGRAEALLERKWPQKYNRVGQAAWHGRIYGNGRPALLGWAPSRIYQGIWGTALFQSVYEPAPNHLLSLARMPEWNLVIGALAALVAFGGLWRPLLAARPLLMLAVGVQLVEALWSARRAPVKGVLARGLVALLYLLQPLARLCGRLGSGLGPWRLGFMTPGSHTLTIWSERGRSAKEWMESIGAFLRANGATWLRGGHFDRWDLEVWGGALGAIRLRVAVEEHGGGRQLVRARIWPHWSALGISLGLGLALIALGAAAGHAQVALAVFGGVSVIGLVATLRDWYVAAAALLRSVCTLRMAGKIPTGFASEGLPVTLPQVPPAGRNV